MAKKRVPGQLGLFKPETTWTAPTELPDLRGRPVVALDTELKDDGLGSGRGPGWAFGAGYLCGVSWAAEGSRGYAPVRHPDSECHDQSAVLRWVRDLHASGTLVVFHNSPYDVGWLGTLGVPPPARLGDTLAASVMVDEGRRGDEPYSLDGCCRWLGLPGKDKAVLRDAVAAYGGDPARPQADIWRVPARYVGEYAETDAVAVLRAWPELQRRMVEQELEAAYALEMELVPMFVAMRRRGVRVNIPLAVETASRFRLRRDEALAEMTRALALRRTATMEDLGSSKFMERVFQSEGVSYPRTPKTKVGSFASEWMLKHPHWLPRLAARADKYEMAASKFVDNYVLSFAHRGRLHAEIHQFRSDDGGTRSHRLSLSSPPLQQMTSPDKDPRDENKNLIEDDAVGAPLRDLFLPEEGEAWLSADYSQQEPRMTVHFAAACRARGADAAVERYVRDPRTDYHQMVADMTGLPRPRAKILNLAMTYGKGARKTAEELGVSLDEAELLLKSYHERLPFIKALDDICKRRAAARGHIRLIDGARMHYNEWEGGWIDYDVKTAAERAGKRLGPCSLEEWHVRAADPDHPWHRTRPRRADVRKALNNLIQGSAARQTKLAGVAMWREGVVPLLQMHDEWAVSVGSRARVDQISRMMVEAAPLLVPVVVDAEVGPTWGRAKMSWEEYVEKYGGPQLAA